MSKANDIVISGVGVNSAIGQGQSAFWHALSAGEHKFSLMQREGRYSVPENPPTPVNYNQFIGAEFSELIFPETISKRMLRSCSLSAQVALLTLAEAWDDAILSDIDPTRIGLIVGGSNTQQRELLTTVNKYQYRSQFIPPNYAVKFMDTDIVGVCTETFGIKGLSYTLGGASASGQMAVIQAANAVASGQVDVCIALGALQDISYLECQAFRHLGAMAGDKYAKAPELSCRPFDQDHNGFVFGEACGAVVIEKADGATIRAVMSSKKPYHYAKISGWGAAMDANRNPNASVDGEVRAIASALAMSQFSTAQIDYINPHGSGSPSGDETELAVLKKLQLQDAAINTTKSITGHSISAAGAIEIIATLLQMKNKRLHPSLNLINPIDPDFNWIKVLTEHNIQQALCLSYGFGGINTALCLEKI